MDDEICVLDTAEMTFFRDPKTDLTHISPKTPSTCRVGRQRISIVMVFMRIGFMYLMTVSPLDHSTERQIRQAIQEKLADRGVLVIAQRVATVRHADEIFVLDQGRILDRGSHEELAECSEVYKEILASQLKSQEGEIR